MNPRAERRCTELLSTARRVVAEGGFRELSMHALAEAAGVAVGTPYRYFPSKGMLCAQLVAHVSARELQVIEEIAVSEGSVSDRLRDAVAAFTRRAFQVPRLAYAMIAEPVDPEVEDVRLEYRARISAVFQALLEEGVETGVFACPAPDTAAACITGAFMEAVIAPRSEPLTRLEIDMAIEQASMFCLLGVLLRSAEVVPLSADLSKDAGNG